jgi:hypothetical protein
MWCNPLLLLSNSSTGRGRRHLRDPAPALLLWRPVMRVLAPLRFVPRHASINPPPINTWPNGLLHLSTGLHLILVVLVAYRSSLRRFWAYLVPFSQQCLHMSSLPSPRTLTAKSITLALISLAAVRCVNLVLEAFDESFV